MAVDSDRPQYFVKSITINMQKERALLMIRHLGGTTLLSLDQVDVRAAARGA